jgi:magnesium-transporting ATPase (P-type)
MTDKTGTLTQNIMDFKCLYVDFPSYGSFHSSGANQPIASGAAELRILTEKIPNVDFA